MGVKKGSDNFRGYRKERSNKTIRRIEFALEEARRHKLRFADEKKLASWVASRIEVHRTTIIRSPIYMAEIRAFFERQSGIGSLEVGNDSSSELMLAKIKQLELTNSRLSRENDRLKAFIEKQQLALTGDTGMSGEKERKDTIDGERRLQGAIADMSRMFMLVVQRFDGMILINEEAKTIEDASRRRNSPGRVIAGVPCVEHFFDWYGKTDKRVERHKG